MESEFKSNRQLVLIGSLAELKPPSGIGLPNIVADAKKTKMLSKDIRDAQKRVANLKKHLVGVISKPTANDPVYKICQRIFHRPNDPIVLSRNNDLRRQIRHRAFRRFLHGCPPRKSDDVSIGDAFNWEWMVYCAIEQKAELVIVTRDTDFGAIIDGEFYINDHLKQEFQERVSKRRKLILCSRLTDALKHFKVRVTNKEVEAEAQVMRASEDENESDAGREKGLKSLLGLFGRSSAEGPQVPRKPRRKVPETMPPLLPPHEPPQDVGGQDAEAVN